ncbi:hypothetical protein F5X96DRAFT_211956 [Biscogniauxia mediterranea]|nr:hypothetical protein F5X96DRAFT_211956 [Biscogniauxia mediterranea]
MAKDRDSDNSSSSAAQSKRPTAPRHNSDSQVSDHTSHQQQQQQQYRSKPQKHVVGGAGRFHGRVASSKALHSKNHGQSSTKLNRRLPSPSPERPSINRRNTSELKLSHDSSSSTVNLKKNSSHSNLAVKRNRSQVDIGKRAKSTTHIKRSSSHKDVAKLKGAKGQVHFDLGTDGGHDGHDGHDDEWVDASGSASPYMSRRGSVISTGHKEHIPSNESSPRPHSPSNSTATAAATATHLPADQRPRGPSPNRQTAQHNNYITSRLLQRTPSHSIPPKMTVETATASVPPNAGSPESQTSRGPPSLYGTPKTATFVGSGGDEVSSRFVNGSGSGPGSGATGEIAPIYTQTRPLARREGVRRPQSLGNLNQTNLERDHRESLSDDEDDSALAPRTRRPGFRATPAGQSRTQQKLNLQRASSTIEPTQAGGGVGVVGASPLVGGTDYDNRDPRVGKLLERTGMEYLVVRRYQNPIARSIARLSHLPDAHKSQRIPPKQNGVNGNGNGAAHGKKSSDGGFRLSQSLVETTTRSSRPTTPRRTTSIRTNGANSSFEAEEDHHHRMSGSSFVDGMDEGVATLLRNLWDKNMDICTSQE